MPDNQQEADADRIQAALIAEYVIRATSTQPTRRLVIRWPDPESEGGSFQVVYLPAHVAVLFEHLEPGAEIEVIVRKRG